MTSPCRLLKYLDLKKNCHCEGEARTPGWPLLPQRGNSPSGNPHPQNLTVLDALRPKWKHFGERIATAAFGRLAMTAFFDTLKGEVI